MSSTPTKNLALVFSKAPESWPVPGEHLTVEDLTFSPPSPLPANSLVVEVLYSSFDPYLRGLLRDPNIKSYFPALPIHQPIRNDGLARVLQSSLDGFQKGDLVQGRLPMQQYYVLTVPEDGKGGGGGDAKPKKLDHIPEGFDVRHYLGALGMPGLTAYSSLYEIGKPKKGETIFISSAAGAVGQLVGQLAKHEGMKVFGSVGSDEKLKFIVDDLGFDGGFNYKKESTRDAFKRLGLADSGIDIYYDNVGGEQLATSIEFMATHGRIVACGQISQYNVPDADKYPIRNLMLVVGKRLTIRGFIVADSDFGPKYAREHRENVTQWLQDGSLRASVHETVGMEKSAEGFIGMLKGENFGKAVLKVQG